MFDDSLDIEALLAANDCAEIDDLADLDGEIDLDACADLAAWLGEDDDYDDCEDDSE